MELVEAGWNRLVPPLSADSVQAAILGALGQRGAYVQPYGAGDAAQAVSTVSSEMPEVLGMSDRIVVMCQGRVAADIERDDFDERRILAARTRPAPCQDG